MRLEEYLKKRKEEDGINEYDIEKSEENAQICAKYVQEYFNDYLNTTEEKKKAAAHEERKEKYAGWVKDYSDDIRKWLVDMYSSYGKYLYRTLPTYISDPYFLLYDSETEFRALSKEICPAIIRRYRFLDGQEEMIYRFIKDEYRIQSEVSRSYNRLPHISEHIDIWMNKTYQEHGVNIYSFCKEYLTDYLENSDMWPDSHKLIRETGEWVWRGMVIPSSTYYVYDYKQKDNLFGIDILYEDLPKKEFIVGKKQELEAVLLYYYCVDQKEEKEYLEYWEEYAKKLP